MIHASKLPSILELLNNYSQFKCFIITKIFKKLHKDAFIEVVGLE